ncbi:peptidase [Granulicella sp. 5B5]|uniref:M14 family metallopeptidase n=1 Tax=Granulicella sp. 5B5 TaxID=1617967 RepID=UPI0015F6AF83|nr:M14 metallopeptidase family protein [Granulicella sp. 5B5]QMV17342.1 peptidase [Granulicella sp. 5B5]
MLNPRIVKALVAAAVLCLASSLPPLQPSLHAQRPEITTPKQEFGFNIGDDYQLVNYVKAEAYLQKLASESDRMKLVSMGKTSEGRTQWMVIISSPENLKHLDHYRDIAHELATARDLTPEHKPLTDEQAHALAHEGKSIVWIDGGLHATEVVGAQQIVELIYEMNAKTDPETMRFLDDDILLAVFCNPDGMDLVSDWYNREPDPAKRKPSNTPRLWNHYAGHDDNRDFFMSNLAETTNMDRVLFRTWNPEIVYNHHQTGPPGTVIFVPPFRDPFNYHYDPLMIIDIDNVGMAIHQRFIEEGKPGSTMRSGATYSTWYNGGLRTSTYFHNTTGILTEIIGNPTPEPLPLIPAAQLAHNDLPFPVPPQTWHFMQSIVYEQTANRAILDYASRNRERMLYDTYHMGKNSILKGDEDSWTITPKRIAALEDAAKAEAATAHPAGAGRSRGGAGAAAPTGRGPAGVPADLYKTVLEDPAHRDPRGYILPSDQPDFPTATRFVDTLMKNGVTILQATSDFTVNGKHYPKNSYIVKADQAFRPQILDMFEPQDHPDDFKYPGGPPIPPYDVTGYNLSYQMGIQFDREYEAFDGPFAEITTDLAIPVPGTITGAAKPAGYLVSHAYNDSFTLTNRLLKAGCDVYWMKDTQTAEGKTLAAGALWIPASAKSRPIVETAVHDLGISAIGVAKAPHGEAYKQKTVRIGLADVYGGNMPSGWTRFILEHFEFPYEVVYPQAIDAGHLHDKYDVLIFPDGVLRLATTEAGRGGGGGGFNAQPKPETIPAEFRPWLGTYTKDKSVPALKEFAESGGAILTIGSSTSLGAALSLPVSDGLTELTASGTPRPLPPEKFYIPGSLLRAQVDNTNPLAYGLPSDLDVFFDRSPAFRLLPNAALDGVSAVSWYQGEKVLDSGWAWGQQYLNGTTAVVAANLGKGKVFLFGPEITFRGQPHGTFKFLFNGIAYGAATPTKL